MIYDCPVRGTAEVRRVNGAPEWVTSDPEVHIMNELLEDADAMAFLTERYGVQEPCPFDSSVTHARLKETSA